MHPALANQNLDPPTERVLSRGLLPALVVNAVLIAALVAGVNWKFGGDAAAPASEPRTASSAEANDTARMGGAPTPPAEAPVPAWPTTAAAGAVETKPAETTQVAAVGSTSPSPGELFGGAAKQPERAAARVEAPAPAPAPAPAKAAAAKAAPAKAPVQVAKAEEPVRRVEKPVERRVEGRAQPSFDCAKARSTTERLICADPELARLDRDLGRVHAQAKRATPDPLDFKRENDDEWRLRESVCRDKDCLLEWYGHRKQQLEERMAQGR